MMHLITVVGKSARNFFLDRQRIPDFKSLMRTITSGRVMIISTNFRSDLFYRERKSNNEAILKLWALYANTSLSSLDRKDCITSNGDQKSLSTYFLSINKLSAKWDQYRLYTRAFQYAFNDDEENPVARTIVQCDQYLVEHPSIKRAPLFTSTEKINSKRMQDTHSLAMHIIKNETHSN